jgi:hypothetical protein
MTSDVSRQKGPYYRPYVGLSGLAWTVVDGEVAEEAGFEPAIRFPVCTLSKRVP